MNQKHKTQKLGLIGRATATLESYISGPLRAYFLSQDYVYGVAERRNEVHSRLSKAAGWMFAMTTLLAFFDSVVGIEISFLGFKFVVKPVFAASFCFLASASFLSVVFACIDVMLIDSYLATLVRSVHMYSFGLYTLPKSALNLWTEAFTPKFFGPISSRGHKVAMIVVSVFYLALLLLLCLYPTVTCGRYLWLVFTQRDASVPEYTLGMLSTLVILITWVLGLAFTIKFEFRQADFNEADGTPTQEFVARVQAEVASASNKPSL